jgi:hypothetical protein
MVEYQAWTRISLAEEEAQDAEEEEVIRKILFQVTESTLLSQMNSEMRTRSL